MKKIGTTNENKVLVEMEVSEWEELLRLAISHKDGNMHLGNIIRNPAVECVDLDIESPIQCVLLYTRVLHNAQRLKHDVDYLVDTLRNKQGKK